MIEKLRLNRDRIDRFTQILGESPNLISVNPARHFDVIADAQSDNMFLDCAVAAHADFIISGDSPLLNLKNFEAIEIVSPQTFWKFCVCKANCQFASGASRNEIIFQTTKLNQLKKTALFFIKKYFL